VEYIQRQIAGFLGIGDDTDPVLYGFSSRVWDMRDCYPANQLQLADGKKISFETQIAASGSLSLPLPASYASANPLFVLFRATKLVKVVTVDPLLGTSSSLCRPGLASDQNGLQCFCQRITSITVSVPGVDAATIQYMAFEVPDLTLSSNWRQGYQTTGVYTGNTP
jgi:hypothetical protein